MNQVCVLGRMLLVGLAALAALGMPARAQTAFRDAGAWCSITFPKDWKQAALDKVVKLKRDASVTGVEFRAGFAKALKNGEMEMPFAVLVAQPHEMKGIRYDDFEEKFESELRTPIFAGVQSGPTEFYLADDMVVHYLSIAGMKGSDARAVVYTFLTKNGLVHLACFDTAKKFEASQDVFDEIAASVVIDPGQAFQPSRSSSSRSGFGRRGIYGLGGGLGAVVLILLRAWARR